MENNMKILVIGGGGREHALAWKLAQSPSVSQVYVAPGNAGTAYENGIQNVPISDSDIPGLLHYASQNDMDLTVVGPEAPLVQGIVDTFLDAGLKVFGPTQAASRLEGSKAFSKAFMARHRIPTARYESFTEVAPALQFIHDHGTPLVIKADGLAAGKGVVIAHTQEDAREAVHNMLSGGAFGAAGHCVVIEEFLEGEEASFICMVDGVHALPMASSQDHKARDDGDRGPNTGGMGAYSPAPVVTPEIHDRILNRILRPTIIGLASEGMPYVGFLYVGVMIDAAGNPKVLEFNCRLGDPETQPIMMRFRGDLYQLIVDAINGDLGHKSIEWDTRAALGVVLASQGYPGAYHQGEPIDPLPTDNEYCKLFHAGTSWKEGHIINTGGRVLCATALGETVDQARARAYELAGNVPWPGKYYRTDIGHRAISRTQ